MNEVGVAKLRGVFRVARCRSSPQWWALGFSAALIYQLEPGYKASAVIRAGEVQPAKEYVAPTVAEQMGERLKSLRLSVMARPLVAEAANKLGLFRAYPKKADEIDDIKCAWT